MSTVDLAVIGNGMFGALLDGRGRFVWCCMDTFDGDPIFNCLINNNSDKTGFHDLILENFDKAEQCYLEHSAVLVTTLHSNQGDTVEIRDFAPRFHHYERLFRPFQLIRTVRNMQGDPRVTIRLRPTFQYNSTDGYQTRGSQHVRFCGPNQTWRATTNTSIRHILEERPFLLPAREPVFIVFGSDESFTNSLQNVALDFEAKTTSYWSQWCCSLCLPVEFQQMLVRAAITVALLQSEECGGLLSAMTMNLPLGPRGGATRDARVCRLLDECLALAVLRDIGLFDICRKFLSFIKEVCFQPEKPQHSYTSAGSAQSMPLEWEPCLAGYRGMGEVYRGGPLLESQFDAEHSKLAANATAESGWQSRTVVHGLIVVSLAHAFFDIRLSKEFCTPKLYEKLELYAFSACESFRHMLKLYCGTQANPGNANPTAQTHYPKPPCGAGFFDDHRESITCRFSPAEYGPSGCAAKSCSEPPAVHTLTSILCWAAADRLQRIAAHFKCDVGRAQYWQQRAVEIHKVISHYAWNRQRETFTTYWGGQEVGPSLLRIAELGFISSDDRRFTSTVRAFEADALQYAVCVIGPDHKPTTKPSFSADELLQCSSACFMTNTLLWYCEALRSTGSTTESRRLLEALVLTSTHRGILSESIDLANSELWGNSPSLSALLSLLRVVPRLSRSWREV